MSLITPTSYNQAQYGVFGYHITAIPQSGIQNLFDGLILGDAISGNPVEDLLDLLVVQEWIDLTLIKANIWNKPAGPGATWTTPPLNVPNKWTNQDAPNQIP
jgi:hypothetical protein